MELPAGSAHPPAEDHSAHADAELAPRDRAAVRRHLLECRRCADVARSYRVVRRVLRRAPRLASPLIWSVPAPAA
jgi:anti-sigma factor RsiW